MRPRNGPPEAVSTSFVTVPGCGSERISWWSAECSESTGIMRAPGRLGERHDQLAADHQRLLVGERDVDALGQGDDRGARARRRRRSRSAPGRRRTCRSASRMPSSPGQHPSVPLPGRALGGIGVREGDHRGAEALGLLQERLPARAGREPGDAEVVGRRRSRRAPACRSTRSSRGSGPSSRRESLGTGPEAPRNASGGPQAPAQHFVRACSSGPGRPRAGTAGHGGRSPSRCTRPRSRALPPSRRR